MKDTFETDFSSLRVHEVCVAILWSFQYPLKVENCYIQQRVPNVGRKTTKSLCKLDNQLSQQHFKVYLAFHPTSLIILNSA